MNAAAVDHSAAPNCTEKGSLVQSPPPRPRSRTLSAQHLSREERRLARLKIYPDDVERPRTRGECVDGPRPCPFVSCSHHLYLDVTESGGVKVNRPDIEVEDMKETCALDVADRGGITQEEIGDLLNLTRSRVQQVEAAILAKLQPLVEHG